MDGHKLTRTLDLAVWFLAVFGVGWGFCDCAAIKSIFLVLSIKPKAELSTGAAEV